MNHVIRAARADEWAKAKELRLVALQDPAAPVAFLDSYEDAVQQPDSFWQERSARATAQPGAPAGQFIAEAADGSWAGSVVVLIEDAGTTDFGGAVVKEAQGLVVGVFVRPEHRGTGLIGKLIGAALDWAWSIEEPRLARVLLHVHPENLRAQGAYRRIGFEPTGVTVRFEPHSSVEELELAFARPGD